MPHFPPSYLAVAAVFLCSVPSVFCAEPIPAPNMPEALPAEERKALQDRLRGAVEEYNKQVAASVETLRAYITRQRLIAQRRGDIDLARRCETAEQELAATAAPLNDDVFKVASDAAQRKIIRAGETLAKTYDEVAKRYLRADELDAALDLRVEKEELLALNEAWEPQRNARRAAGGLAGPARRVVAQRITCNYRDTEGRCVVGEGEQLFGLMFSSCSDSSVYLYRDDPSVTRVAVARGLWPIMRFANLESTARSYTVGEGQAFFAENINGFYLMGRMLQVRDASRGEGIDSVTFEFVIKDKPGDDTFAFP